MARPEQAATDLGYGRRAYADGRRHGPQRALRLYDKGVVGAASEITDTFAGFRSQVREGEVRIPHVTTGEPLRAECDAFLSRIRGGDGSLSDGWAGAEVIAVLEAMDRSIAGTALSRKWRKSDESPSCRSRLATPEIVDEIMARLEEVLTATAFIQGPQVAEFEEAFAAFCDVRNCIGVASGTDALEMAVSGLGLGSGDEVIVPANSFIASALGVIRAGAQVTLVDCDPDTYLIDIDAVEQAMSPKVKAVMPVHLFGQTAPVEELSAIVGDATIIEDAAQSQGARRQRETGRLAGAGCRHQFLSGQEHRGLW